jgi:hypothetical protein
VEKLEGKRRLGRARCRWEDNIKMNIERESWIGLFWLRIGRGSELF